MINAFARSTKNAETKGNTTNAKGAGPYRFVTDDMFAMAVGVAPNAKPANPALRTAELKFDPKTRKTTKSMKVAVMITCINKTVISGPPSSASDQSCMLMSDIARNTDKE